MTDNLQDALREELKEALAEVKVDLRIAAADVVDYMHRQAQLLAPHVGQPYFGDMKRASSQAIALFAGLRAHDQARYADGRIIGFIDTGLAVLARALVV